MIFIFLFLILINLKQIFTFEIVLRKIFLRNFVGEPNPLLYIFDYNNLLSNGPIKIVCASYDLKKIVYTLQYMYIYFFIK